MLIKTRHLEYALIMAFLISIFLALTSHGQEIYELNKPENRQILDDIIVREVEPKINQRSKFVTLAESQIVFSSAGSNDTAWHDLDLSTYTTSETIAVQLLLQIKDSSAGVSIAIRKNGDTPISPHRVRTQVANIYNDDEIICGCDSGQVIEYNISQANVDFTYISLFGYIEQSD